MCVAQADYYRILTQGERSIQCIEEGGAVVMVTEFRKTDGGSRQGQVVIKVCNHGYDVIKEQAFKLLYASLSKRDFLHNL